ncbi:MAG: flagellar basal body-associated FliL family protein [Spirochaetia bacterium]|nr:flagellar basal body-associated FliL family protein [Treponema sp.]MCI6315662.1 flagellar basal body-associated FliL family protein [Spirochaetia bacterium]MBQ5908231.1 flagellar basal body-associated FliL family protein [Treponema sp.]MCI6365569.1 flagellar basal body-associated FliL family protein [Spirochaetia bacterium]MCI6545861.1 flagellar basal body-associated FliL family protein [Spirochaetia bacterium]
MADDGLDGLEDGGTSASSGKKGGMGGALPGLLKWVAIALGAIILIVVIVVVTVNILNKNTTGTPSIPISDEYVTQREILDWYTSLGAIRTKTSDDISASVVVDIALGYKKDDKATSTEITQRNIELKDFLRRYFTEKTIAELKPQNEQKLKIELRNAINDEILSTSKIRDISFLQLDVLEQ